MGASPLKFRWLDAVIESEELSTVEKAVGFALARSGDRDGERIWPGNALVARRAQIHAKTAERVRRSLERKGWVEVVRRGGIVGGRRIANEYRLALPVQDGESSSRPPASDGGSAKKRSPVSDSTTTRSGLHDHPSQTGPTPTENPVTGTPPPESTNNPTPEVEADRVLRRRIAAECERMGDHQFTSNRGAWKGGAYRNHVDAFRKANVEGQGDDYLDEAFPLSTPPRPPACESCSGKGWRWAGDFDDMKQEPCGGCAGTGRRKLGDSQSIESRRQPQSNDDDFDLQAEGF
jgi:hypothetical protein